ncbi:probable NADH dehydrogenase [ubiquinone] 1 alpha subcomplex subunit 12 [Phlebotomus argentipes]|uniref:probable NADH dehydrogenase [ubiquinone] 1 alpha subcomplex subunit 12 n=1 Tax=Phlebotomus argentipes TaxID=94469 RepID=UPI002892FE21|nr:probable NADH dehydrogenase [ubiquinone] 1 alpha subcomplex subunit 12 [Phlebotomus argentipes]
MSYFGLDRVSKLFRIIQQNGGIRASLYKLYRMDDLKEGRLVGEDKYGNKYYENPYFFYGRNRWVEYSPDFSTDYDGSQIPADWFGWMHYKTDLPPDRDGTRPKYKWMVDHSENMSGTPGQYMPYTTTRPKIEAWDPSKKQ